jgi:hypothetical protein
LNKKLKIAFKSALATRLPQFEYIDKATLHSGYSVYGFNVGHKLALYLCLWISPKEDSFTVECIWSSRDDFRDLTLAHHCYEVPEITLESVQHQKMNIRIGVLMPEHKDRWLYLDSRTTFEQLADRFQRLNEGRVEEFMKQFPLEQAIAQIPGAIAEAMTQITEHALPYFAKIAKMLDIELSCSGGTQIGRSSSRAGDETHDRPRMGQL